MKTLVFLFFYLLPVPVLCLTTPYLMENNTPIWLLCAPFYASILHIMVIRFVEKEWEDTQRENDEIFYIDPVTNRKIQLQ